MTAAAWGFLGFAFTALAWILERHASRFSALLAMVCALACFLLAAAKVIGWT